MTCSSLLPDVSDEVLRNVEFVCDVLTGVDLPGDAELDEAEASIVEMHAAMFSTGSTTSTTAVSSSTVKFLQ